MDVGRNIWTRDEEKAEVLSTFFVSVFSNETSCSLGTQLPELVDRHREQNEALINHGEMVSKPLRHVQV